MIDTVLVLGATGKTGRRLVPQLVARGIRVRAASRRPAYGGTTFAWDDPTTHDATLRDVDAVYLVPPAMVENATPLVGPFLGRARAAGVRRVVLLSSLGLTFPGESADSGRVALEQLVMNEAPEWTTLRPSGFNQNFSEGFLLPGIVDADAIVTPTGDGAVPFVDAEDIAAVAVRALLEDGHDGAAYALTGSEALSFAEAAALISRAAGRTITHRAIPAEAFAEALRGNGMPDAYARMLLRDLTAIRDGVAAAVHSDDVVRVTGRPATRFADYVAAAADAWKGAHTPQAAPGAR